MVNSSATIDQSGLDPSAIWHIAPGHGCVLIMPCAMRVGSVKALNFMIITSTRQFPSAGSKQYLNASDRNQILSGWFIRRRAIFRRRCRRLSISSSRNFHRGNEARVPGSSPRSRLLACIHKLHSERSGHRGAGAKVCTTLLKVQLHSMPFRLRLAALASLFDQIEIGRDYFARRNA